MGRISKICRKEFKETGQKEMTNREYLTSLSDREFAEYILSIYIAGKMHDMPTYEDYEEWLQKEHQEK